MAQDSGYPLILPCNQVRMVWQKPFDWGKILRKFNSTLILGDNVFYGHELERILKDADSNEMVPQSLVTMSRTLKIMALWNLMNREG